MFDYYSQREAFLGDLSHNQMVTDQFERHNTSLMAITDLLKLLENLFQIDSVKNESLRDLIAELFSNDVYGLFLQPKATLDIIKETQRVTQNLETIS